MPFLHRPDGAQLHYWLEGDGPALVLAPGGTGLTHFDWEYQLPWLRPHWHLVSLDLRAHGRSTDPQWQLSMFAIGEDLLALLDQVSGLGPPVVMAFSAAATGILMCLAREPERAAGLAGLVLVASSVKGADLEFLGEFQNSSWPRGLQALEHEAWPGPEHWRRLRRTISSSWAATTDIAREDLSRVTCPILAVNGALDQVEPPESALTIAEWAPNAEAAIIADAGHIVMRHRPDAFRAAVEPFLDRLRASVEDRTA